MQIYYVIRERIALVAAPDGELQPFWSLPCAETVGRRDAADEPTWTYSRRVSKPTCREAGSFKPDLEIVAKLADARADIAAYSDNSEAMHRKYIA
jgi:hypothetical protein